MSTYYVSDATGNDGNSGLSEVGAWATIDKAMNTVAAGDKVYVKADGLYIETPSIDTSGTLASPIVFEGYTTTPGDGGQAAIQGEIQDSITGRLHYIFKNFDANNSSGAGGGRCVNFSGTQTVWKNCIFHDNTAFALVQVGNQAVFEKCEFNDGFGDGLICAGVVCVGCKFYRNQISAIDSLGNCICAFCEFFSSGTAAVDGGASNDTFVVAINCTIDGDNGDITEGLYKSPAAYGTVVMVNNIIYDCVNGARWGAGGTDNAEFGISLNNLLNDNSADYAGGAFTSEGEVTSAPQFTDEASNDYTLGALSPARSAGYDLQGNTDIGANQTAAGGGGGLLVHPGTSGGARG